MRYAIKFGHKGGATVEAELIELSEETVVLHIGVADAGTGINKGALYKILTPFIRAYSGTIKIYTGAGLGRQQLKTLWICNKGYLS